MHLNVEPSSFLALPLPRSYDKGPETGPSYINAVDSGKYYTPEETLVLPFRRKKLIQELW